MGRLYKNKSIPQPFQITVHVVLGQSLASLSASRLTFNAEAKARL